jgi:hypothetical protein
MNNLADNDALWASYPKPGRRWFLRKLRDHFPEAEIKGRVDAARGIVEPLLAVAHPLFAEESGIDWTFSEGRGGVEWDAKYDRNLRAEILYGLLGMHPEFFVDEPYLRLIARRRYRIAQRMRFFVDPFYATLYTTDDEDEDKNPVFTYPDTGDYAGAELNPESTPEYWEKQGGHYPFVLTDAGKSNPKLAIEALFTEHPPPGPEQRNRLGCAAVAMIVHLDSLLATNDPEAVLGHLVAWGEALGVHYLRIDHPVDAMVHRGGDVFEPHSGTTVAEPARAGAERIRVEMAEIPFRLVGESNPVVARNAEHFIDVRRPGPAGAPEPVPVLIIDGVAGVSRPGSIAGIGIDSATRDPATRHNGWLEVAALTHDVPAGARLVDVGGPWLHFLNDPLIDKALFERVYIDKDDLQVGDHVILSNHPLYEQILVGAWAAEHSFVTSRFNDDNKLWTFGHGLSDPIEDVAEQLLEELNEHLDLMRAATLLHVRDRPSDRAKDERCTNADGNVVPCSSPDVTHREAFYLPFAYTGRDARKREYIREVNATDGTVSKYKMPDDMAAYEADRVRPVGGDGKVALTVKRERDPGAFAEFHFTYEGKEQYFVTAPGEPPGQPRSWGVLYLDGLHVQPRFYPLFTVGISRLITVGNWLGYRDLQNLFPIYGDPSSSRIPVIRPRVDFRPEYRSYLTDIGALPQPK